MNKTNKQLEQENKDLREALAWIGNPMLGYKAPHDGGDVWITVRNRAGASDWFKLVKKLLTNE